MAWQCETRRYSSQTDCQGLEALNFEFASCSSLRDFFKNSFCDDDVGDGSVNAICIRPEVDEVISDDDVDTFQCYACVNL